MCCLLLIAGVLLAGVRRGVLLYSVVRWLSPCVGCCCALVVDCCLLCVVAVCCSVLLVVACCLLLIC